MADKQALKAWIVEALIALGGEAHLVRVAEPIRRNHESDLRVGGDLRAGGDLFFTWHHDMRWAAQDLQDKDGRLKKNSRTWELT